jgi:hypothetical protein
MDKVLRLLEALDRRKGGGMTTEGQALAGAGVSLESVALRTNTFQQPSSPCLYHTIKLEPDLDLCYVIHRIVGSNLLLNYITQYKIVSTTMSLFSCALPAQIFFKTFLSLGGQNLA